MKRKIKIPVIVEGKYDKIRLSGVIDGCIIPTGGFSVFRDDEKRALIRALGKDGVIILCDSDGGGKVIRSKLKTMLGGIKVYDLYVPQIRGKEKRKSAPSKAGFLGVEGIDSEILMGVFDSFATVHPELFDDGRDEAVEVAERKTVSVAELYELGLSGGDNSAVLRDEVCVRLGLPRGMSGRSFLAAVEMMGVGVDELAKVVDKVEVDVR